ncbi:MAG: PIG-L family deacetylase, partial [Candidatus Glassbacteria bacterium]|nr:PIG-L family deacetylase [Candidatus Glassbacteria bacterium]
PGGGRKPFSKGFRPPPVKVYEFSYEEDLEMSQQTSKAPRVIMIGAHPDDSEHYAGGTAALWAEQGAAVLLVSVTNGDAGHQSQGGGALAKRRTAESRRSAEILGVESLVMDFHDGELEPSLEVRKAVIRAIRSWRADIVISHRPYDYHPDHRYTSQVVQDAAFLVTVPCICPDVEPLGWNPVFLFFGDSFLKPMPFSPDVIVDVGPAMDKKVRSFAAMESQVFEWLPWLEGKLESVPASESGRLEWLGQQYAEHFERAAGRYRKLLAERYGAGRAGEVKYAEGFELCEYGSQPSREELWEMLPK